MAALVTVLGLLMAILSLGESETEYLSSRTVPALPADSIPIPGPRLRARQVAVEAAGEKPQQRRGGCEVRVTGERPAGTLFVAIYDGTTGARLASEPLIDLQLVRFREIPEGRHIVRLTRSAMTGRSVYIAGTSFEILPNQPPRRVELTCNTTSLRVRLADSRPPNKDGPKISIGGIPVLLRRTDDPLWRYRAPGIDGPATSVRTDAEGTVTFEGIGTGEYSLSMVGFEPDPTETQRLRFDVTAFDQDRPIRGVMR